jgi:hypothetical protein
MSRVLQTNSNLLKEFKLFGRLLLTLHLDRARFFRTVNCKLSTVNFF